jgi:MerR-like DNA binding protein
MRKNLAQLQEEMKAKQHTTHEPVEERPACANCVIVGRKPPRLARRGSTLCSRCTYKAVQNQLRDTLPGMRVEEEQVEDEVGEEVVERTIVQPSVSVLECDEVDEESEDVDYASAKEALRKFSEEQEGLQEGVQEEEEIEEIEEVEEIVEQEEIPQGSHYTRKQVSRMVGVSPTTICRWEAKGATPLPKRFAHNNQLIYTDEIVAAIKEYANQVVDGFAAPSTVRTPQELAAKGVGKKTFKINKRLEKVVSLRINQTGFRSGKLM